MIISVTLMRTDWIWNIRSKNLNFTFVICYELLNKQPSDN